MKLDATLRPVAYIINGGGTPVDWRDDRYVLSKVSEWATGEQGELQLTDYIESRALRWIKELEQIADIALSPYGDLPPDYDLAAKILFGLLKFSSPQPPARRCDRAVEGYLSSHLVTA